MDLFRVVYLNSVAAERFSCGDLCSTEIILIEALRCLHEVSEIECSDGQAVSKAMQNGKQNLHSNVSCENRYSMRQIKSADGDIPHEIYNSMFLLSADVTVSVRETAAIVLFNVALLHHRTAIKFNSTKEYTQALQIYKKSLDLLKTIDMEEKGFSSPMLTVVMAAVFHNMANIFATYFRAEDARLFLMMLEQTLECIKSEPNSIISNEDLELFKVNLAFAKMDDFSLAPAA